MSGPSWFVNIVQLILLVLIIWSLVWIYRDAKQRGKAPWGAVLFAIVAAYPTSLLWWLWLRPPLLVAAPPQIPQPQSEASR